MDQALHCAGASGVAAFLLAGKMRAHPTLGGTMSYPLLSEPLTLNGVTLRNRTIMGSMHTGLEDGSKLDGLAAFYAERARGGVGLIVTGGFSPNIAGTLYPKAGLMRTRRDARRHRVVTLSLIHI